MGDAGVREEITSLKEYMVAMQSFMGSMEAKVRRVFIWVFSTLWNTLIEYM